jgi:predicted small integral membrane protein
MSNLTERLRAIASLALQSLVYATGLTLVSTLLRISTTTGDRVFIATVAFLFWFIFRGRSTGVLKRSKS